MSRARRPNEGERPTGSRRSDRAASPGGQRPGDLSKAFRESRSSSPAEADGGAPVASTDPAPVAPVNPMIHSSLEPSGPPSSDPPSRPLPSTGSPAPQSTGTPSTDLPVRRIPPGTTVRWSAHLSGVPSTDPPVGPKSVLSEYVEKIEKLESSRSIARQEQPVPKKRPLLGAKPKPLSGAQKRKLKKEQALAALNGIFPAVEPIAPPPVAPEPVKQFVPHLPPPPIEPPDEPVPAAKQGDIRDILSKRKDLLFNRFFDKSGNLTADGVEFMNRKSLKGVEKEIRDEMIFHYWGHLSGDDAAVQKIERITGIKRSIVESTIRDHMKRLLFEEGGAEHLLSRRLELEQVRHQSKVKTIERLHDIVEKALAQTEAKLAATTASQAAVIAGILTDKALLLAGQATSRIARMDERFMSPEEMKAKMQEELSKLQAMSDDEEKLQKLKVVKGGG